MASPPRLTSLTAARAFLASSQPILSVSWLDADGALTLERHDRHSLRVSKRIHGALRSVRIAAGDVARLADLLPPQEELDALHE